MLRRFSHLVVFFFLMASSGFQVFSMRNSSLEQDRVKIAVMAGPTAFSVAGLNESEYDVAVLKTPNDAVARLSNGETDLAILPSHLCFMLLQKDDSIRILAITGEGNLSMISDMSALSDAMPQIIHVPAKGSTPDFLVGFLYPESERDYSYSSPVQLSAMLAEGKVSAAVLPEPYSSIVLNKNPNLHALRDIQTDFKVRTGHDNYPISILVTRTGFLGKHHDIGSVMSDFKSAWESSLKRPEKVAKAVSRFGFISEKDAAETIGKSGICFYDGEQAEAGCSLLYDVIRAQNPKAFSKDSLKGFFYPGKRDSDSK